MTFHMILDKDILLGCVIDLCNTVSLVSQLCDLVLADAMVDGIVYQCRNQ